MGGTVPACTGYRAITAYDEQHDNFTSGNTTTVYDAAGRNVGRVTTNQRR
jgi:hypothetical protein